MIEAETLAGRMSNTDIDPGHYQLTKKKIFELMHRGRGESVSDLSEKYSEDVRPEKSVPHLPKDAQKTIYGIPVLSQAALEDLLEQRVCFALVVPETS